jgi:hypothetical protein
MRMLGVAILFLVAFQTPIVHAESCKTILNVTRRLECYDNIFGVDHLLADILSSPRPSQPSWRLSLL